MHRWLKYHNADWLPWWLVNQMKPISISSVTGFFHLFAFSCLECSLRKHLPSLIYIFIFQNQPVISIECSCECKLTNVYRTILSGLNNVRFGVWKAITKLCLMETIYEDLINTGREWSLEVKWVPESACCIAFYHYRVVQLWLIVHI